MHLVNVDGMTAFVHCLHL